MSKTIKIPGRLESAETGNVVAGANAIFDDIKEKKQNVINQETDAELLRLDQEKQGNLTFDQTPTENSTNPVTSGGVYAADQLLSQAIEAILLLIPSAASALNKLVDMNTMNSSISTATASFKGTYNLVSDLHLTVSATHAQIAAALDALSLGADNNDYSYVQVPNTDTAPTEIAKTERYKFNGTNWAYEYDLNNSGFTSVQWNAINSGITTLLVGKLSALPTNEALTLVLAGKQDNLTFDDAPTAGSNNPVKSGGIYTRNAEIVAMINALDTAKQNVLTFDTAPTNGSTNPVTSNGIYVAISALQATIVALDNAKQNVLTFDSTPTLGSNNPVTSSGIKTQLNRIDGDIVVLNNLYQALTQSALVIVEPADTWPVASPDEYTIYRVIDRVNTPPTSYSDYMWNGTTMVLMATYNNAIDPRPKKASQNLVTSGGVFDNMGALDVSELNATGNPRALATYANLTEALAAIPSDYQKGGMTIKYVQTSDNKYAQYRLMADTFGTTESDWQGVDDEPTDESNNLVKSGGTQKSIVLGDTYTEGLIQPINAPFKHDGFWYLNSGVLTKLEGGYAYYTDPITFLEGYKLDMIAALGGSVGLVYMVFDANDNLIDSHVTENTIGATVQYNYTAPANSAYIICSSELTSELIHCTITKDNNIQETKLDKENIVNNLFGTNSPTEKVLSYFWSQYLSNMWGYLEKKNYINIYGRITTYNIDGIESYCSSAWIPINDYTKERTLFGLCSQVVIGVAGLAFYSDIDESSFIGYYLPNEDDGVTRGDHIFDVTIKDAIASNNDFANAKYCRFTSKILDYNNINKKPVIELVDDNFTTWTDGFLKNDGTVYTHQDVLYKTSDYIPLNDVTKNLFIYGASSYARAGVYALCFYNLSKQFVGIAYKHPDDDASTTMEKLCTISIKGLLSSNTYNPDGIASFFRICYDVRYGFKMVVESINSILQKVNDWDARWSLLRFNKTICIGDSVTKGFICDYPIFTDLSWETKSYPAYLAKLMNSEIINAGYSGDTPDEWYEGRTREFVHGSLYDYYFPDETTDYDLAIIEFGYNKGDGNDLQWSDLNVEHSNMWAYDQIISGIKSKNPKIEIVLMIPSNGLFVNNHGIAEPIERLAVRHNCKLIDLREDLTIHLDTEEWHGEFMDETDQQLHYDMVHFTAKGYTAKTALIYKKLIELYKE